MHIIIDYEYRYRLPKIGTYILPYFDKAILYRRAAKRNFRPIYARHHGWQYTSTDTKSNPMSFKQICCFDNIGIPIV